MGLARTGEASGFAGQGTLHRANLLGLSRINEDNLVTGF